jgi:hypothetical protein
MNNHGHGEMHMDGYSFMGIHWFELGFHIDFLLVLLAVAHQYRRKNNLIK